MSLVPNQALALALSATEGCPANTRRAYARHIVGFLSQGLPLTRSGVQHYLASLRSVSSRNQALSALKRLVKEAAARDLVDRTIESSILNLEAERRLGVRTGNWLTAEQAGRLLSLPDRTTMRGCRDAALLSLLIGCGLRRSEAAVLTWDRVQTRWDRTILSDIMGKGGRVRSVAVPEWADRDLRSWAGWSNEGHVFRRITVSGGLEGPLTPAGIWAIVQHYARRLGIKIAPHDLRRTYAALAYEGGADTRQIQAELGHASLHTTERYLREITGLQKGRAAGDHVFPDFLSPDTGR